MAGGMPVPERALLRQSPSCGKPGAGCVAGNNPTETGCDSARARILSSIYRAFSELPGESEVVNLVTQTREEAKENHAHLGMNIINFDAISVTISRL
jgi:hypothetical protein